MTGNDEDLAQAIAITKGEKEWEYDGMTWTEESYHRFRHPWDFPDIADREKTPEEIKELTKDSKKLTLIWESNYFHDVHLISPAKFWKRANIPQDVLRDFWRIVIEPDEELKKKTSRRGAMDFKGEIKVIDGEKEYIAEKVLEKNGFDYYSDVSYYKLPYQSEIANLDYSILHGFEIDRCHFKVEIEGGFDKEKLSYDEKTATLLYDGKEFEIMPYCLEKNKWITFNACGS